MKVRLLALLLLCLCSPAFSQNTDTSPLARQQWEIGPWLGGGTGLGKGSEFKIINSGVRIGCVLTNVIGDGRFRGTFEWASDIIPLYLIDQPEFYNSGPSTWIYAFSATPLVLKWNWVANKKVTPYFAAEGGFLLSTKPVPGPNTSNVNFTPGGAFGMYVAQTPKHAVDLSIHITHISNASLGNFNPGINATMQFRVGYTWFK
ncbi:MAG TPA: acyloxyacyl hydrolase [Terriglobales bacterium]|nr:acyloxyacyl hydrolase [Terriglobales bacterium]